MKKKLSVRLPLHIRPDRYQIMIRPDLEGFIFSGEETIFLSLKKSVRNITLHAVDLEISDVIFKNKSGKFQASGIRYNIASQTATFSFADKIQAGTGQLFLKFRGQLTDKLKGFYRSRYEVDGQSRYMATTQFEATDARRAFPCFDEPAQKAVFDVTMAVPGHMTAISNSLEAEIKEHEGGYKLVTFAPTPKMSTYLLAFIAGEFEFLEAKSKNGVLVRVFTTPGKKEKGKFALDTAVRCLDFYEDYFAIPYPLPVLDLIAIPDFASGAMENWGAVTYRETGLLFDEVHSSASNKQRIAIVIAHELAHQWFGNLVTMEWWTHLWLNEGFATYMEYLATDKLFPHWNIWEQYVSDDLSTAMRLDGLSTTHPIEIPVMDPAEIGEIFDQISYAKGSVVIRMLAEFLGFEKFRNGLRHYLKKHRYGNAVTGDLWKSFEAVSKRPVGRMMSIWTRKAGYPVVAVREKKNALILSQTRFFSSPVSKASASDLTVWPLPIKITYEDGSTDSFMMDKKLKSLAKKGRGWAKLNTGETSLMRTKYDPGILEDFGAAVSAGRLPGADRLGIIRDAFSLSEAGDLPAPEALKLAEYYRAETELPVWEELIAGVYAAGELHAHEPWYKHYQRYGRDLLAPIGQALGWERQKGESHATGILRSLVLSALGRFGEKRTIEQARLLFARARKGAVIPADLRGAVYGIIMEYGGVKEFQLMKKMYKESAAHPEEQSRIGSSLGRSRNQAVLAKVLDFSLSEDVRSQDAPAIFIIAARNSHGRDLAWKFLKTNWNTIERRYNVGGHLLEWFIAPFSRFSDERKALEVESFFAKHPAPEVARTIQQVIERIRCNASWVKRDRQAIARFVKTRPEDKPGQS